MRRRVSGAHLATVRMRCAACNSHGQRPLAAALRASNKELQDGDNLRVGPLAKRRNEQALAKLINNSACKRARQFIRAASCNCKAPLVRVGGGGAVARLMQIDGCYLSAAVGQVCAKLDDVKVPLPSRLGPT